MNPKSYSFKLGSIDCTVLLDGARVLGKEGMMGRFPYGAEADYRQAYADLGLSFDEADDYFNILLAEVGGETVLVDSGEGGRPHGGCLLESMRLANIAPEDVTLVVITHGHGDHVLGLLTDDNEPVFPNATYVMSKEERADWQARIEGGAVDHGPILAVVEARGLRLVEMDEQIVPGLSAVPAPGHTPGHIAILLESDNERLMHMSDLLLSPMQFAHPEWCPVFDRDTTLSVSTRRAVLQHAADEALLALFYHLPFPGLGRVEAAEEGFAWVAATDGGD